MEEVLARYSSARSTETITKANPVCAALATVARLLGESGQARRFPNVMVKWSAGQGNWATIPWIAALDSRETSRTSEGVYVVYLFCADMSGVYLTLNQGTTRVSAAWLRRGRLLGAHRLHRNFFQRASKRTVSGVFASTFRLAS